MPGYISSIAENRSVMIGSGMKQQPGKEKRVSGENQGQFLHGSGGGKNKLSLFILDLTVLEIR